MTRTSRRGSLEKSAGTVLVDALISILILSLSAPSALVATAAVVRTCADIEAAVVDALSVSDGSELRTVYDVADGGGS